jgi:hypothetical protein
VSVVGVKQQPKSKPSLSPSPLLSMYITLKNKNKIKTYFFAHLKLLSLIPAPSNLRKNTEGSNFQTRFLFDNFTVP